ncbi:1376_t:CDS:2 [Cetraspora pellucida]|uniref:1376_t:CDS:1 n=1 Tax=Cetraspora pellucida TaxID=1433469 RepID=A0ACA9KC23_9GLOM|nr:1376_t:CDS:2 [Cetraspora pellucida]
MPDNSLYSLRSSSIRNNGGRFSITTVTENSNSEYSDSEYNNSEYSDPELLIYELENSNETNFDNEKTELNEEEAKQLIYENTNNNSISEQLNTLNNRLKNTKNINAYEYLRLLAVYKYLNTIFFHEELQSRIELSFEISQQVFQHGPWMARHICEWSKRWITTGALPIYRQGQRKYTQTLIDDEDVQSSCLHYIHTIDERITAKKFQQYIQNNILPHLTSSCTSILLETARTWLCSLGLVYQQHQQDVYYDGYECLDVVQYRSVFLEKMKNFESLMPQFVGENMDKTINPEISKEQRIHIFVTHDEYTFYANDSHPSVWTPLSMLPLCKKGMGKALMISEFLTETRGRLTITLTEITKFDAFDEK